MRPQSKVIAARLDGAAMQRRQTLVWAAAAMLAVAGATLAGRRALGLTIVDADAATAEAFHGACGPIAYHQKLLDEARKTLLGEEPTRRTDGPLTVDCPLCGCKVGAGAPSR